VATRVLAEQSLKAEQDKFSTAHRTDVTTVIQAQKDLVNDQTLEAQAMANYTHARVSFDQALDGRWTSTCVDGGSGFGQGGARIGVARESSRRKQ